MSWVSEAGTEKAWLHQRRTDVEHNLQHAVKRSREETLTAAEIASAGCWTEGMQVEVDKQVAKATVKKAIACEDDLLLPDERDGNLLASVEQFTRSVPKSIRSGRARPKGLPITTKSERQ